MKTQTVSPLNPSPSEESESKSGSDSIASAWSRLQALSCRHANVIYGQMPRKERQRLLKAHKGPPVPEDIAENCAILKRGDEAELKNRAYWYITFYPAIFDECSKAGWKY